MKLVCFALKEEAAPFQKIAAAKPGLAILITGIGRQNAEKSVREFLTHLSTAPDIVLTCGFAGGLDPNLKIGEVLFEIGRSRGNETLNEKKLATPHVVSCEQLIAAGAKPAKIFCADRVAITVADKKKLRDETGADAAEMESAAIQAVCAERGIPCATLRVISDTANEDLPLDFNLLAKPDKNPDYGKLLLAVAKSPGKIGALMELQKKTKFAAERLAEVLSKILQQPGVTRLKLNFFSKDASKKNCYHD